MFDFVILRRIGRQEQQMALCLLDKLFGYVGLMEAGVIEDNGLAWGKFWYQRLLNPCIEDISIAIAGETAGSEQFALA